MYKIILSLYAKRTQLINGYFFMATRMTIFYYIIAFKILILDTYSFKKRKLNLTALY